MQTHHSDRNTYEKDFGTFCGIFNFFFSLFVLPLASMSVYRREKVVGLILFEINWLEMRKKIQMVNDYTIISIKNVNEWDA